MIRSYWKTIAVLLLMVLVGVVQAAVDRIPNSQVGALYKVGRSTLTSGDFDSLAIDVNHNLLVSNTAGPPATGVISSFTTTASNGATAVTLVTATASQEIILYSLTISNFDTVAHTVDVTNGSAGQSIEHFTLSAGGSFIYDGAAGGFSWRTAAGQLLAFHIDAGGSAATVAAIGYYVKQ